MGVSREWESSTGEVGQERWVEEVHTDTAIVPDLQNPFDAG
jgi:hypothetical protein